MVRVNWKQRYDRQIRVGDTVKYYDNYDGYNRYGIVKKIIGTKIYCNGWYKYVVNINRPCIGDTFVSNSNIIKVK